MATALLFAALLLDGCASPPRPSDDLRPNLILLLADDLGWGDLGAYGGNAIRTPQLDRMAAGGMRWTQFYAASAVCSPTRSSCLTGRYPLRFGFTRHGGATLAVGIPDETVTLPRLLQEAGYATAHVGKWHVGKENMRQLGFDRFVRVHYPRAKLGGDDSKHFIDGARYMERDGEPVESSDRFMTEALVDEALRMIDDYAAGDRPFFLNLWFYAPHTPYNLAPEPYVVPYEGIAEGDDLAYRSMVTCLDAGIGRILARLEELGIDGDTLVVFVSDNGPSYQGSPGPWTGGKGDLHEGGIRMPMIAYWPSRIERGAVADDLGHTNDLLPTFVEAAGLRLPAEIAFDGISLLPRLDGQTLPRRGPVFWQMDLYPWYPQPGKKPDPLATEIVRLDRWKLFALNGVPTGLFDLEADPGEEVNLVGARPEQRDEMVAALQVWLREARKPPPK
jgi:N-acetylgalactosamine-6-sulfatase